MDNITSMTEWKREHTFFFFKMWDEACAFQAKQKKENKQENFFLIVRYPSLSDDDGVGRKNEKRQFN